MAIAERNSLAANEFVVRLLDSDPATASEAFAELVRQVTSPERSSCGALVAQLIDGLSDAGELACARILLLLGILCEAPDPDVDAGGGEVTAVLEGLDRHLKLVPRASTDRRLRLALFYLLAHFPRAAEQIVPAVAPLADADALTRLERSLADPDFAAPETADLAGRCWPSPAILAFTDEEFASTAETRRALDQEAVARSWKADTRALVAYAGGYAAAMLEAS